MAASCSRAAFHCEPWPFHESVGLPADMDFIMSADKIYSESRSGQVGFVLIILVIKGTNKDLLSGSNK